MGRFHQADNLRQHGVAADALRFDDQPALLVDGPAVDFGRSRFVHRQAFAGEHGFVDRGAPVADNRVDRDTLARLDQKQVARRDFIDGNRLLFAIVEERGCLRRQTHQLLDGVAGAALGPRFQQLAQRHQCENDGGRFEIIEFADHIAESEQDAKEHDDAVDISGDGAHRHQHIHVGAAVAQGLQRAADELPAQQKHDRRGQRAKDEEPDVIRQECEVVHQEGELVQEVARHAEDGQRHGEQGADFDQAGLAVDFGFAGRRLLVFGRSVSRMCR